MTRLGLRRMLKNRTPYLTTKSCYGNGGRKAPLLAQSVATSHSVSCSPSPLASGQRLFLLVPSGPVWSPFCHALSRLARCGRRPTRLGLHVSPPCPSRDGAVHPRLCSSTHLHCSVHPSAHSIQAPNLQ